MRDGSVQVWMPYRINSPTRHFPLEIVASPRRAAWASIPASRSELLASRGPSCEIYRASARILSVRTRRRTIRAAVAVRQALFERRVQIAEHLVEDIGRYYDLLLVGAIDSEVRHLAFSTSLEDKKAGLDSLAPVIDFEGALRLALMPISIGHHPQHDKNVREPFLDQAAVE
jgi:hypothetical protein